MKIIKAQILRIDALFHFVVCTFQFKKRISKALLYLNVIEKKI